MLYCLHDLFYSNVGIIAYCNYNNYYFFYFFYFLNVLRHLIVTKFTSVGDTFSSSHPSALKNGLPKSQFYRLRVFAIQLKSLKKML